MRIKGDEPAIVTGEEHLSVPHSHTAVHDIAAASSGPLQGHLGINSQSNFPLAASYAFTLLHAVETYSTPSTTMGAASCPRVTFFHEDEEIDVSGGADVPAKLLATAA